jgi:hypothetical protein
MARRKKHVSTCNFIKEDTMTTTAGREINQGDIIKIQGEWGTKFKFLNLVTNPDNNAQWVDCFEIERGQVSRYRAFRPERVKHIPKKRGKRVKRTGSSQAS